MFKLVLAPELVEFCGRWACSFLALKIAFVRGSAENPAKGAMAECQGSMTPARAPQLRNAAGRRKAALEAAGGSKPSAGFETLSGIGPSPLLTALKPMTG